MPRPLPPAPVWSPTDMEAHVQKTELTFTIKVVTPLFGGGYEARVVDVACPIRAASIRGHLRFWWRATAGANCPNAADLFKKEAELWGSDKEPGKVSLRIQMSEADMGTEATLSAVAPRATSVDGPLEGYFLFPYQANKSKNISEAIGRREVRFTVRCVVPQTYKAVVQQAVCAWLIFGGVGARTRRGCGALQLITDTDWMPTIDRAGGWLTSFRNQALAGFPAFTTLANVAVVLGKPQDTAKEAWREAGLFWASFRKGHVGSITYTPADKGMWQDYRNALLPYNYAKTPTISLSKPFFGLPTVYQEFDTAPYAPELKSESTGRMASPIIVKPLAMSDGRFRPMVAVLKAPRPKKIRIGSDVVSLTIPTKDPVLLELKTADPLEAVIVAAERLWGQRRL